MPKGLSQPDGPFILVEERSNILFKNPTTHSEEGITGSASHLLEPKSWQYTKEQHILLRGFALNDANKRLNVERQISFKGREGASVEVSVNWQFGTEALVRTVSVRGEPISELEVSMPYEALASATVGADELIAKVGKRLLDNKAQVFKGTPSIHLG